MTYIKIDDKVLISRLQKLRGELGHEPSTTEIDDCPYLPSARQIQRRFSGIANLRKKAGFTISDHTKGSTRSATASVSMQRASAYEKDLINKLMNKYDAIRHFAYQQWLEDEKHYINITCDAAIRQGGHMILIDFFYPQNMHSYGGCVRAKRIKLEKHPVSLFDSTYEVLFVCVNRSITQEMIDTNGTNKGNVVVLSLDSFEKRFL